MSKHRPSNICQQIFALVSSPSASSAASSGPPSTRNSWRQHQWRDDTHTKKKKEEEMLTITNEEQQKWNEANIAAALLSLFLSLVLFLFLFFVVCRCKCGATMATMATLEEPFHFEFDGRHFIHRLLAQVGFPFGSSAEISKDKDQRVDSQKSMRWNVGWRLRHPHRNGENRWVFVKNFKKFGWSRRMFT